MLGWVFIFVAIAAFAAFIELATRAYQARRPGTEGTGYALVKPPQE